jgi:alanine racemase
VNARNWQILQQGSFKMHKDLRSWVEIDLSAFSANFGALKALLPSEMEVMQIVKADGYGHGAGEIATKALECGAMDFVAVDKNLEQMAFQLISKIKTVSRIRPMKRMGRFKFLLQHFVKYFIRRIKIMDFSWPII